MARPSERLRLKDKIVDDVSKAIKSIQEQVYLLSKDPATASRVERGNLTLSNGDRQSHKLCDKLDHAFLHGLKDVTHGYWKLFKFLSHKGTIREIDLLTNVTTDLGRGRAWLYISLNEGLLESYIRLLGENEKLVKKHYNKEALVLDGDRMNVLLTLTSGLDFVTFQLDYDLPYLDLSPSPPRTQIGFGDDYIRDGFQKKPMSPVSVLQSDSDTASACSYDIQCGPIERSASVTSSTAASGMDSNNGEAKDSQSVTSHQSAFGTDPSRAWTPTEVLILGGNHRIRAPSDAQSITSTGSDFDRHQRFENIVNRDLVEEVEDSLEVIRVVNKKKKKKSKSNSGAAANKSNTKMTRSMSSASESTPERTIHENDDMIDNLAFVSSSSKNDQNGARERTSCEGSIEGVDSNSDLSGRRAVIPQLDSGIDICDIASEKAYVIGDDKELETKIDDKDEMGSGEEFHDNGTIKEKNSFSSDMIAAEEKSSMSVIESKIAEMCGDLGKESTSLSNPEKHNILSKAEKGKSFTDATDPTNIIKDKELPDNGNIYNSPAKFRTEEHGTLKDNPLVISGEHEDPESASLEGDEPGDFYDVYSSTKRSPSTDKRDNPKSKSGNRPTSLTKLQEASHLQDYMDCVLKGDESSSGGDNPETGKQETVAEDYSLSLDNNTKLQVMLEIFKQEDETFVKMFACRENHTEGHFTVAFVLISDHFLYLLHYHAASRKFRIQSVTKLTDIIFISTGLYEQTLNIESRDKSRQKQRLWLTPGHQDLTKAVVQCLTDVVKEANAGILSVRSRFSVGSDVPLQKIGLRKYISKEMNCEAQDVLINDYSLVFWEDPSSSKSSYSDSVTKEGTLLLRVQDPIKSFIWKPVYVVLQGSMLSVSNSKSDPQPHSYLGLGGDQCIGCRLTEVGERPHCVELVLAQGVSWFLSAASEIEILDWRRSLCLAVSQGVEESGVLSGCTPCCCIQASNQLFLCHEDLDTKFFRTLGRAQMEDVTGVSIDQDEPTYCVVEFESQEVGVSSGKWVFHFASASDGNRFVSSLVDCWKEIFQVELLITILEDVTLQRHCQSYAKQLRKPFEHR